MRRISSKGKKLIMAFESFRPQPYYCPAGLLTIGYGHLIGQSEYFSHISESKAETLLIKDLDFSAMSVLRNIKVPLNNYQFDALISFTFNVGAGALQRSSLRIKLNNYNYDDVPNELMRWVWAGTTKLPGLIKRRQLEALLYLGQY